MSYIHSSNNSYVYICLTSFPRSLESNIGDISYQELIRGPEVRGKSRYFSAYWVIYRHIDDLSADLSYRVRHREGVNQTTYMNIRRYLEQFLRLLLQCHHLGFLYIFH